MSKDLEAAALSGELFRPRSRSPARSASTASVVNTDDELGSDFSPPGSPGGSRSALLHGAAEDHGGPQTGPKGVMQDEKTKSRRDRQAREEEQRARAAEQVKHVIVAPTVDEEAAARAAERDQEELRARWRRERREELQNGRKRDDSPRRGGLKEVGQEGFITAVERRGWVVVLIYEPDIPRCQPLLASMLHLSLNPPETNEPLVLLRARATTLSFSLLPSSGLEEDGEDDDEGARENRRADPDVLPTLLAYRDGELEKTWIRVDWETGEEGVEGLLRREGVLPPVGQLRFEPGTNRESDEDEDE